MDRRFFDADLNVAFQKTQQHNGPNHLRECLTGKTNQHKVAPLAQLDRASVYGTEGYWFEPSGVYFS
jgi:hypothetical protein